MILDVQVHFSTELLILYFFFFYLDTVGKLIDVGSKSYRLSIWKYSYLWEEWKEKHKDACEDLSSKFFNLRFVPLEVLLY